MYFTYHHHHHRLPVASGLSIMNARSSISLMDDLHSRTFRPQWPQRYQWSPVLHGLPALWPQLINLVGYVGVPHQVCDDESDSDESFLRFEFIQLKMGYDWDYSEWNKINVLGITSMLALFRFILCLVRPLLPTYVLLNEIFLKSVAISWFLFAAISCCLPLVPVSNPIASKIVGTLGFIVLYTFYVK